MGIHILLWGEKAGGTTSGAQGSLWQGPGNPMRCGGSNLGQSHARQATYSHPFSPTPDNFMFNTVGNFHIVFYNANALGTQAGLAPFTAPHWCSVCANTAPMLGTSLMIRALSSFPQTHWSCPTPVPYQTSGSITLAPEWDFSSLPLHPGLYPMVLKDNS